MIGERVDGEIDERVDGRIAERVDGGNGERSDGGIDERNILAVKWIAERIVSKRGCVSKRGWYVFWMGQMCVVH